MKKELSYLIGKLIAMIAIMVVLIILAVKGVISWGEFVISLMLDNIMIKLS